MMDNRKKVAALICGMFGCVFLGGGDWLMMYGNTAYRGQIYWLTEGVAQIPSWRNSLSMLVAFPAVLLYGIALFTTDGFVKQENISLSDSVWADTMAVSPSVLCHDSVCICMA